jgi:hypothetical protein
MASYATVNEADAYFATRLDTLVWDDASDADKTKALAMATRAIDRLNFVGSKAVSTQELQFPRGADSVVPNDIVIACCECAYSFLDGYDPNIEHENLVVVTQGIAEARTTYNRDFALDHVKAGIPSTVAWNYLKQYMAKLGVKISRVD